MDTVQACSSSFFPSSLLNHEQNLAWQHLEKWKWCQQVVEQQQI